MFKLKEIEHIILAIIVLIFIVNFKFILSNYPRDNLIMVYIISIILIVFINLFAKKLTARYFEANIETKIWMLKRFGVKKHQHFKKKVPAGIIIPFIISIISMGQVLWLAVLEFDVHPMAARVSKRHEKYKYTEMAEIHLGLIAAAGVALNLLTSIIGYLAGFPEFTRLSVYYAAFSLVPIGQLDGTKIFFGNKTLWFTLVIITAIFLGYAFMLA